MKKKELIWLIAAFALVVAGAAVFWGAFGLSDGDFTKLSTEKYEHTEFETTQDFENIRIDTETADIEFIPSENEKTIVSCYDDKSVEYTADVDNDTLVIKAAYFENWMDHVTLFGFENPSITVYLPKSEYKKLTISLSTGDVDILANFTFESVSVTGSTGDIKCYANVSGLISANISTGRIIVESEAVGGLDLTTSTGNISVTGTACAGDIKMKQTTGEATLTDVLCKNLNTDASTGDIRMKNVIAQQSLSIKRSTGDVKLDGCDAAEIYISTDTGSVTGTLLSEKVFLAQSDTGSVETPKTITGGRCEITTDTGDIRISIE